MILSLVLALAVQDATVTAPEQTADGTQRWSVLAEPCATEPSEDEDIVVCGRAGSAYRLPLPGERPPPNRPLPSNPDATGAGALAATRAPCGTLSQGCTTGVDLFGGATFLVRAVGKLVDPDSCCEEPGEATNPVKLLSDVGTLVGIGKKREKVEGERVPIPLD
ncbi:hypothetical protein [Sphingomonas japonica]|uniref:Secreted protein n=1 Tax=Sphingomonas japonica TaxID=511662 RepID=A0ABX0TXJ6_9SPHN|nr:hypothetical protein [Sphingomonas japonica]NIJ22585.1 hypothetical protein [Sphingomonas japonica]